MRGGNLRVADLGRKHLRDPLVECRAVRMHEHDRARAKPCLVRFQQTAAQGGGVERADDDAVRVDALVGLDHTLVEKVRQDDVPLE